MQGSGLFLPYHAEEVGPVVGDIDPTVTAQNQGVPVRPTSSYRRRSIHWRYEAHGAGPIAGARREDSGPLGPGLCRILDADFRECDF
jgi:hypothetical protein